MKRFARTLAPAVLGGALLGCYETFERDVCREVGCPCISHADCYFPESACDVYRASDQEKRGKIGAAITGEFGRCVAATVVNPGESLLGKLNGELDQRGTSPEGASLRLGPDVYSLGDGPLLVGGGRKLTLYGEQDGSQRTHLTGGFVVGNLTNDGTLTLDSIQFDGANPPKGTAIDCSAGAAILRRVSLQDYAVAVQSNRACRVQLDRSRIAGNQAALNLNGGGFSITNSLIVDNRAEGSILALATTQPEKNLALSTLRNNTLPDTVMGASIVIDLTNPNPPTWLAGLILADNGGANATQTGGSPRFSADLSSYCSGARGFGMNDQNCQPNPMIGVFQFVDPSFPLAPPLSVNVPVSTNQVCPLDHKTLPRIGDVDPLRFDYLGKLRSSTKNCGAGAFQEQPLR